MDVRNNDFDKRGKDVLEHSQGQKVDETKGRISLEKGHGITDGKITNT